MASLDVGIVGGGLMGLALARRLASGGHRVTVLEQADRFGGLATYHDFGGFFWDRFYHVVLPSDTHLVSFLHEIGLGTAVGWKNTQTGVFIDHQFYAMNNAVDFLKFPPLNLLSKIRLGWTIVRAARIKDWQRLEQLTAEEWLCASCGRQTFEKFWKPLLLAKLGEQYQRVSAVFIWSYIKRLFSARHSAAKKEQLGYIAGGYKAVFDRLVNQLVSQGGIAHTRTTVRHIAASDQGGISVVTNAAHMRFDKVVFTGPTSVLERVTRPELASVDHGGSRVEYLDVVCTVLVTRKPLLPYYVLNIADEQIPFTGVIGISNIVPPSETGGFHLTYLPKYLPSDDPLFRRPDEEIRSIFLDGLGRMLPDYKMANVVSTHVNRAAKVQPLQVVGYSKAVPRCRTLHQDFFVLNTAQFLFGTLNNNEVIGAVNNFVRLYADQWAGEGAVSGDRRQSIAP
jgi:protoporphyrinogen oxidase